MAWRQRNDWLENAVACQLKCPLTQPPRLAMRMSRRIAMHVQGGGTFPAPTQRDAPLRSCSDLVVFTARFSLSHRSLLESSSIAAGPTIQWPCLVSRTARANPNNVSEQS